MHGTHLQCTYKWSRVPSKARFASCLRDVGWYIPNVHVFVSPAVTERPCKYKRHELVCCFLGEEEQETVQNEPSLSSNSSSNFCAFCFLHHLPYFLSQRGKILLLGTRLSATPSVSPPVHCPPLAPCRPSAHQTAQWPIRSHRMTT